MWLRICCCGHVQRNCHMHSSSLGLLNDTAIFKLWKRITLKKVFPVLRIDKVSDKLSYFIVLSTGNIIYPHTTVHKRRRSMSVCIKERKLLFLPTEFPIPIVDLNHPASDEYCTDGK